jgi:hypothetical protein
MPVEATPVLSLTEPHTAGDTTLKVNSVTVTTVEHGLITL